MINLSQKTIYIFCGSLCLLVVAGILLSLLFSNKNLPAAGHAASARGGRALAPRRTSNRPLRGGCQRQLFPSVLLILLILFVFEATGFCDYIRRAKTVITHVGEVESYESGEIHVDKKMSVGVYDGDTIFVEGHTIRLFGVDAPELEQFVEINGRRVDAGLVVKQEMVKRINSLYQIRCVEFEGYDRVVAHDLHHAEYVARCLGSIRDDEGIANETIVFIKTNPDEDIAADHDYIEYVVDIGAWLVFKGLAVATSYSTFSVKNHAPYEKIEETAREKEVGIWKKNIKGIVQPVDWRRAQYEEAQKENEKKKRRLDDRLP